MTTQDVRIKELITAVGTDWKNIWAAIGTMGNLDTVATDLVEAINEVYATAGGSIDLDDLTDVVLTGPTTAHLLRHNGTNWVNVLGTTYFDAAGAAAAAQSASQPLDSDLTAIAALGTTSYGRALLELANQAALMALVASASDTVQGKVELATDAETLTGTDTARAVTPANLAALFTDRIDTNTALGSSNTKVPSQAAVKAYSDALIGAMNVLRFVSTFDASANPNYAAADAGDLYVVSVAGKVGGASGVSVEAGDLVICLVDGSASGNQATVGANWDVIQVNLVGAVTGPASSVSGQLASFNGTSGKLIQDSGLALDTDGTLTANSDAKVPSQKAVKTYAQPLDSDLTAVAALSTTSYGRAFLELANQAALMTLIAAASETVSGKIEIATQTETNNGVDDVRAVTPLKLQTRVAALIAGLSIDDMGDVDTTTDPPIIDGELLAWDFDNNQWAPLSAFASSPTDPYGIGLLSLVDSFGLMSLLISASETIEGKIELATQAETNTGTDDARAVTPLKLQTRMAAYAQPLDSDLTSIAAVSTTSYGRAFLALVNQAALMALIAASSETASGIIEIATQAETNTGTDDVRAITPLKLTSNISTVFGTVDTDYAAYYTAAKV